MAIQASGPATAAAVSRAAVCGPDRWTGPRTATSAITRLLDEHPFMNTNS
jgi:hypothetical protein